MGGLPWKEQSQVPMEKPCYGHASQAGGRWQLGPCPPLPALTAPPFPIDSGSIRRLPCPPPVHSPATEKLSLAFPIQRA